MSDTRHYILKKNIYSQYKPNQTVIFKKRFLKYLPGIKWQPGDQLKPFLANYSDGEPEEFYPSVNSYYPFTEDVDAFARVNHLLASKQSADSLKVDDDFNFVNEYSERKAEHQYLRSKALCFLVLGKPGLGQEELGRRLANYWKAVYIDPQTLIEEEIASNSRPGQCIEFNLRCGRAIGIDILMRLLAKKIQVPEVLHRGYVCCGFPLIHNDLYEEDPISSESAIFTVQEIFDELIERTAQSADVSAKVAVSMVSSSKYDESKFSDLGDCVNPVGDSFIKVSLDWTIENQACGPPDIATDLERQLNCIFGLFTDPFMIIYLYGRNSDVVTKRNNYYFDHYSSRTIDIQKINLFYANGASNEDLVDDLFGDGKNPFNDNPTLKHIVKTPENLVGNINTQLDRYHNEIANALDCKVLEHEQQYYIKLDGRSFISQMMELIKCRLKILPLQPVIIPQEFTTIYEEIGEGPDPSEHFTIQEAFQKFSKQDNPGPMFKWRWSDWGPFCPISMFHGIYEQGSPKYPIHLTNKIYFLSKEENYRRFIQNPSSYLLPPFPKPGSNILIFGPPVCGKTAAARCLSYLLNSKVLTLKELQTNYLVEAITEYKERVRQSLITEAMEILKETRSVTSAEKDKQILEWEEESIKLIARFNAFLELPAAKVEDVFSSFPMKVEQEIEPDLRSLDEENMIRNLLVDRNFPSKMDKEYCSRLLEDRNFLMTHLPDALKREEEEEEKIPSPLDPFVLEYTDTKIKEIRFEDITPQVEDNLYDMYSRGIANIDQQEYDGWIIDDMSTDLDLIQQIWTNFSIHEIVILTSDHNYLIDRFQKGDKTVVTYRDFRNFFLKIGERDAAWRAPSTAKTQSYKEGIAKDIISNVVNTLFDSETIEQEKELSVEEYRHALEVYEHNMKEIFTFLEKIDAHPLVVNAENLSIERLLEEVLYGVQDQYRRAASEFTEADRAEEVQQFLSQTLPAGEGETDNVLAGDLLAKNRRYGDTSYYDPVTFATKFVLRRGKEDFAAKFKDKIYLCANEANLKAFIQWPRKFLLQNNPPERFPPPRVCVVGPNAEVVTKVSKSIARNLGIRFISFDRVRREAITLVSKTALHIETEDEEVPLAVSKVWHDIVYSEVFFEEPLKYVGFIIDGFPAEPVHMSQMVLREALPDMVINVTMTREEHLKIQLEKLLDDWRQTINKEQEEEKLMNSMILNEWEEQRKTRYNELMEAKRQNRYGEKIAEQEDDNQVFKSDTQVSLDSVLDQEDHDETMRILDEEFPEPVFEGSQENEEAIIEQFTNEIEDKYDKDIEKFEEIKQICGSESIPFVEVDGGQDYEKIISYLYIITNELKFRGPSLFERCYDVSLEMAEKLLSTGYCFLGSFGRLCPVQYREGHNLLHMYIGNVSKGEIYPTIHRDYIYFLNGKKNWNKFRKNPLKYTSEENFKFPLIPVRIAVIGPPRSGKSVLVDRFRRDLGFRFVSRGQAIRYVLSNPMYTNLIEAVEQQLRKGEELSDEIVMECVLAASSCAESLTQGLVFDGFPNTISEMTYLSRLGLVPHLIYDMHIKEDQLWKQAANPNDKYPQYSHRFNQHRLKEWSKTQHFFRTWCDREYQNIYKLRINRSMWGVWEKARQLILSVVFERKHYYKHVKLDWPLRLAYMLVTPLEFLERQSSYKSYCPACIFYSRRYLNGGEPPDRTGLIQYGKHFYWLCETHIEEFLKTPDKFLPPSNRILPEELPKIIHLYEEPPLVKEDGYCVVCMKENFPRKVLTKGILKHAVFYKGHYYKFDTFDHLIHFMERPEHSCDVSIKFKGNAVHSDYENLQYRELPVLGMLEQYMAGAVVQAVTHVNTYRPVIPGLTISQAALILVGLVLKNRNSKTEHLKMYEEALQSFHQRRLTFLQYLDLMKKYLNPCIHYEEPDTPRIAEIDIDEDEAKLYTKKYSPVK